MAAGRDVMLNLADGRTITGKIVWLGQRMDSTWEVCIQTPERPEGLRCAMRRISTIQTPDGNPIPDAELAGDFDISAAFHGGGSGTTSAQGQRSPAAGLRPFIRFCSGLFVWIGIAVMALFAVIALMAMFGGGYDSAGILVGAGMLSALIGLSAGASITLVGGSTYVLCQIADMLADRGNR
jgi:hypothetical protein